MLFRPAESSKRIVDFYRNYLITTFQTNNDKYNEQLKEQLSEHGAISAGPYISLSDMYAKGRSPRELSNDGILSSLICNYREIKPDRTLYKHQEEALLQFNNHNNLVVTTGTGSGKTECFMLPIISSLLKEKESGTLDSGVRALLIYPMNALVNDQISRLRKLFDGVEDEAITFGRFTGETEEKYSKALQTYKSREGHDPKSNEIISREQMRENPPHILITNYAMLEYLLLRPGDNVFFNETNSKKWKTIVFDEAHTYGGAKGIEVATLIKRLKARLNRNDIQFILTSATLGDRNSNPEIIRFAESLCNAPFNDDSIIRSTPTAPEEAENKYDLQFEIYSNLAELIRNNSSNEEIIKALESYGIEITEENNAEETVNASLYEMIRHDRFYYKMRSLLLNKTKPIAEIAHRLNITQSEFTDFIAVASNAKHNNDKLFEARYHLFIRGMEGVFITLHPSNKLFIKKMETYDDYKCFEVSFCHNCNALYICGNAIDGVLSQKSLGSDELKPEVYLLNGEYDPSEAETQDDREFLVCAKCGRIKRKSSEEQLDCGHSSDNYNTLIKVKDAGQQLHQCPCCHVKNTQRSIVRPYFLGSEAATSVIATALYNELPNQKVTKTTSVTHDDFFGEDIVTETEQIEYLSKQFLAFSDNRQAAAFFASYLESTYRDLLSRRMMTELAIRYKEELSIGMKLQNYVEHLETLMTEYNIYDASIRNKEAWIAVIKELSNQKARNSLQNEGVVYFDVDNLTFSKGILDLTVDETNNLFKVFVNQFFKRGRVSLPITLTIEDEKRLTYSGFSTGFSLKPSKSQYVDGWLPSSGKENIRTKILLKYFPDMDLDKRTKLLESIWKQMERKERETIKLYSDRRGSDKFLVNYEHVVVKSVDDLYECKECKSRYTSSIKDVCPNTNCSGSLSLLERTDENNDPYYYIYRNLAINELIAKEHTAQLGSEKSADYQEQFKNNKINVLSCSTTFEMGVDVGTLETVFMRNMPPSPANYAQRAGRAGRSLNAAAYSITFCGNNSHDLTFFRDPSTMIKGTVIPPTFNVENEKIVLRHIYASAFSMFWRENEDVFCKTIGEFFDNDGFERFQQYLETKPETLKTYLDRIIVSPELQNHFGIENFDWVNLLYSNDGNAPGTFVIAYEKFKKDLSTLDQARIEIEEQLKEDSNNKSLLYSRISIANSINTIKRQQLIEFLSRNNLIPKYGFPVDTVELESFGKNNELTGLRLDRDLFSAISEYAPESEVVADGKLIKSRYVKTLNSYAWPRYSFVECDQCHTLNRSNYWEKMTTCTQCGAVLPVRRIMQYIVPKFGFVMDTIEPSSVGTNKPERTYKGAISYIGDANNISFRNYNICGKNVHVGSSKMDELCVINNSDFYICNICGYGEIFKTEGIKKKEETRSHKKSDGYPCSNDKLESLALGHDFQTDVCLLKFVDDNITDLGQAWTILFSLLEGLSKYLNIDRTELSGCLHWYHNSNYNLGNYSFVLFDNTPGGAGYVRQLKKENCFKGMLAAAEIVVNSCTCGGEAKDTACYGCLCNYYNQKQHDLLKRKYAIDFLSSLKNGELQWSCVISDLSDDEIKGAAAKFNNDGQNQQDMSFEQIWGYLKDDITTETESQILSSLSVSTKTGNFEKPFYNGSISTIDNSQTICADLLFEKSKVVLFLADNLEAYSKAKECDWTCYLLDENFNEEEFLTKITL